MTRAMTLIKMYFVVSLRALTQDVSRRLFERVPFHCVLKPTSWDVSDTALMHLLCTRFTTVSGQVSPLLGELERRTCTYPDELGSLPSECHAAHFSARKNLLGSRHRTNSRNRSYKDRTRTCFCCMISSRLGSNEPNLDTCWVHIPKADLY